MLKCNVTLDDGQKKPGVVHLEITWGKTQAEARAASAKAQAASLNELIRQKNVEHTLAAAEKEEQEEKKYTNRKMKERNLRGGRIARTVDSALMDQINEKIRNSMAAKAAGAAAKSVRRMSAAMMPSISEGEDKAPPKKAGGKPGGRRGSVAAAASAMFQRVRRGSTMGASKAKQEPADVTNLFEA